MVFCKLGLAACLFTGLSVAELQAGSGGWSTADFEQAERLAKQRKSTLLIHFYADWCGPCQKMERDVFSDTDVLASLGTGLISVKVNSDTRRDLASRFGVRSLPSDVFISPDGRVSTFVGATTRSTFLNRLNQFASKAAAATPSFVAAATQPKAAEGALPSKPPEPKSASVTVVAAKPVLPADTFVADPQQAVSQAATEASVAANETTSSAGKMSTDGVDTKEVKPMRRSTLRRIAEKRLGIDGFSPVALTESSTWMPGQKQMTHEYQGVCYRFADEAELQRFKAAPQKYVPVLHGCDPVAFINDRRIESGVIEIGTAFQDRVFFFASEQNRAEFQKNPQRFARSMELSFLESSSEQES